MPTGSAAQGAPEAVEAVVALRDRLLAASWELLGVVEQLRPAEGRRLLAPTYAAAAAHAAERLPPLERWSGLPARSHATYVAENNHVRIARLLDFVEPDDRILDVGIGYGYLTSVLVRSGLPASYCGIDLTDRYVETAREGLLFHGLRDEHVHLEVGDLFDLTREWVAAHDPTLVLMLEVLEHVQDAQRALEVVAASLPPHASLIFTVPMLNRLEGTWGHRSVFDRHRLRALCEHAGLTVQYVEPLHNAWALVLATTTPEVPSRLLAMVAADPVPEPRPEPPHAYVFETVSFDEPLETYAREGRPRRGAATVERTSAGLRCTVHDDGGAAPPLTGGLAFPVTAFAVLRLLVRYDDPAGIHALRVDGYDGDELVARWKWTWGDDRPAAGGRTTHVLKRGHAGRFLRAGPTDTSRVRRVEVHAELLPEARSAAFTLAGAEFLPSVASR